jgi:hypothetical protein
MKINYCLDFVYFGQERTSFFGVSRCLPPPTLFQWGMEHLFSEKPYSALKAKRWTNSITNYPTQVKKMSNI